MTKHENPIGYQFTILSDDVASQDLFEDKTHERVSENIYKIIQGCAKGVTIGLEGSWGSGKSTVIKLLKDRLTEKSEDRTLFFMFDAWAHDGDPLRRIFLESLIREIDPREQDEDLNDIKGKITRRKKVVAIKAKKSTSRLGKFISLSALLIPLGSVLLGKVNYDLLVFPWSDQAHHPYKLFILGVLFCLSPAWVLVYWFFRGDRDTKNNISWEFFSVDTREDYTQDITEDGERTSIEFEDHFQNIIQTATKKGFIDKCIVVIDNLDRVDSGRAKNIWSTLQTFFQKRSNGSAEISWSDKLWFVIPFDYEGFLKIWSSTDSDDEIGKSFLKKCFQLIAEVPHPVMSGWPKYVETCVDEALNQWPEHERKSVLSTYVRYASRLDKSPTPRDIKMFVNQVGLLGAMWGGEISVEAICLHTLFKESITTNDLRTSLVAGQLPNPYQTDADRSDICAELAGLIFGVNKNKGLQLLLAPEIQTAFTEGDGDRLASLIEYHRSAFWIAYEASKTQWMISEGHTEEYKIAFTKAFHNGLMAHKNKLAKDIEKLTTIWTKSYSKLDFSQFDYSESINYLSELCSDKDKLIDSVNQLTSKKLKEIIALVGNEKFPVSILDNFGRLVDFLKIKNKPLERLMFQNLTLANWKVWLDHLKIQKLSYDTVLPRKETIKELSNEVQFQATNLNDAAFSYLVKTYEIYPDSTEWESVADQLIAWLNLSHRAYDCDLIYSFSISLSQSKNNKISDKLLNCIKTANFWVMGQNSSCTKNPSLPILTAIALENELQKTSYVSTHVKSFWSDTTDQALLNDTFNHLKNINRLDVLWLLCRDLKNASAVNIIRAHVDASLYGLWAGTNYIDEYEWANDEEIQLIAEKLIENGSFFDNEFVMKNDPITYQSVYKIFYSLGNTNVCSFIDNEISKATKENWLDCLSKNGDMLDLVKDKNPHFSDAIKESLVALVSGKNNKGISSALVSKIPYLLRKTADLDTTIIPRVINSYFSASSDYLSDDFFKYISSFFESHLSNVDEKSIMERINIWIDSNAYGRIEWLATQNIKRFSEPLESLISRVRIGLKSEQKESNKIAALLNDRFNLGITIMSQDDQETEQNTE
jgi:KAP family P-loop domain